LIWSKNIEERRGKQHLRNEDTNNNNDDEDGIGASECTRAIEYDC